MKHHLLLSILDLVRIDNNNKKLEKARDCENMTFVCDEKKTPVICGLECIYHVRASTHRQIYDLRQSLSNMHECVKMQSNAFILFCIILIHRLNLLLLKSYTCCC